MDELIKKIKKILEDNEPGITVTDYPPPPPDDEEPDSESKPDGKADS
jgi:hypothetical protein